MGESTYSINRDYECSECLTFGDVLTIRTGPADDACYRNLCATCVSSIIPDSTGRRGLSSTRG